MGKGGVVGFDARKGAVRLSSYQEYDAKLPFAHFSIKLVIEGHERYTVNGQKYEVDKNEYLLANHLVEGSVFIDSQNWVNGLCIDIEMGILSEVVSSIVQSNAMEADPFLDKFFRTSHFLENTYRSSETQLGLFLRGLDKEKVENLALNDEFYYVLSEKIVLDHLPTVKMLQNIASVKISTRKHLYRQVLRGKEFIDFCFHEDLSVADMARAAAMSEYHFFRLFRTLFAQSPYQYLQKKRLQYAKQLLKAEHGSVSEVALLVGFADVQSFSKSFKKYFGFAPSLVLR